MNISEASAAATILHAVTGNRPAGRSKIEADDLASALHFLNERAGRALQLKAIVDDTEIEIAARQIAQRAADAL